MGSASQRAPAVGLDASTAIDASIWLTLWLPPLPAVEPPEPVTTLPPLSFEPAIELPPLSAVEPPEPVVIVAPALEPPHAVIDANNKGASNCTQPIAPRVMPRE